MQLQCNQLVFRLSVVLLLIANSQSKILLKVKPATDKVDSVISFSGVDDKKVTGKEINMFNITDDNLKRGIRVEMGKVPNDVFLSDPTPYHNLFAKYKWTEVKRRVQVKKAEVFDIVNQNVTLAIHSAINNTTRRIKKMIGAKETVENTVSSSWLSQGTPEDEIYYNINVTYGRQNYVFKNKRRYNHFESFAVPFGLPTIGYIFLNPGQVAYIELTAVKTILLLKLDYSTSLVGNIIANYKELYGKYHFWAPTVSAIMKAAKLNNEFVNTEFIEVRCYFDPRIKIYDKSTLVPIKLFKLIPFRPKKTKIN